MPSRMVRTAEGGHGGDGSPANPMSQQKQYELFQESLPKVSALLFQMLVNEAIPLATSVELQRYLDNGGSQVEHNKISLDGLSLEDEEEEDDDDEAKEKVNEEEAKEKVNKEEAKSILTTPSHALIAKLLDLAEDNEEKYNNVLKRIRDVGTKMGYKLSNLLIFSNNATLNFKEMDLLTIMKFICRDVWKQVFGKQIDNLKTNHRGTFYLIDYDYTPIQDFCIETNTIPSQSNEETTINKELKLVEPFLELPVGIIKGILLSLGHPLDEVICLATFVEKPKDKMKHNTFPRGISFHVQITNPNKTVSK